MAYTPNIPIMPAVYTVKNNSSNDKCDYLIEFSMPRYKTPNKVYGDTLSLVNRVFTTFKLGKTSSGCLLIGEGGGGKTLFAELLANTAIDNGFAVIAVHNIYITEELMYMLSSMDNVVLLLDEFGKNMSTHTQGKALTMLSDNSKKRLYILTENEEYMVSKFILNRPGRIRYRIDYNKVSKSVIEDYLKDYPVSMEFKEELLTMWNKSKKFTFDHLSCLVTEHRMYPKESLKELLDVLNLNMFNNNTVLTLIKIVDKDNVEYDYVKDSSNKTINPRIDMPKSELSSSWINKKYTNISIKAKDKNNTALNITEEGRRICNQEDTYKYTRDEEGDCYVIHMDDVKLYFKEQEIILE